MSTYTFTINNKLNEVVKTEIILPIMCSISPVRWLLPPYKTYEKKKIKREIEQIMKSNHNAKLLDLLFQKKNRNERPKLIKPN